MLQSFEYHWVDIITGKRGTRTKKFPDRLAFLETLNGWNRLSINFTTRFIYWED